MTKVPIIVSVPHAGLEIPDELREVNLLTAQEIAADGDVGAAEIYGPLEGLVRGFLSTRTARAFVDVGRPPSDLGRDGVIKTHTCWGVPIYESPLAPLLTGALIEKYHAPYHERLDVGAATAIAGVDCHTMAALGPPVGPDPGSRRPRICLSHRDGASCPQELFDVFASALSESFGVEVATNTPFKGGYITQRRPGGIPWIQLELSREEWISYGEKTAAVAKALEAAFC